LDFRGQLAAASLKHDWADVAQIEHDHFRGQLAAASLKRASSEPKPGTRWQFPRPIGRGLIEAGLANLASDLGFHISAANWPRPH